MERPKVRLHLLKVGDKVSAEAVLALHRAFTAREPTADEIAEVQRELAEDERGPRHEKGR